MVASHERFCGDCGARANDAEPRDRITAPPAGHHPEAGPQDEALWPDRNTAFPVSDNDVDSPPGDDVRGSNDGGNDPLRLPSTSDPDRDNAWFWQRRRKRVDVTEQLMVTPETTTEIPLPSSAGSSPADARPNAETGGPLRRNDLAPVTDVDGADRVAWQPAAEERAWVAPSEVAPSSGAYPPPDHAPQPAVWSAAPAPSVPSAASVPSAEAIHPGLSAGAGGTPRPVNQALVAAAPTSAFPPPVAPAEVATDPRQPLVVIAETGVGPSGLSAAGPSGAPGTATAPSAVAQAAIPARPPTAGHRDLVPTANGVPLGGWEPAWIEPESEQGPRLWSAYLLVVSSTLVALATFLPWAEATRGSDTYRLTGWQNVAGDISDGPIHLVMAVVGVICAGLAIGGRCGTWVRIAAAVAGLVSLAAAALRAAAFSTVLNQLDGLPIDSAGIAWGLWLVLGGAFLMTGSALLLRR